MLTFREFLRETRFPHGGFPNHASAFAWMQQNRRHLLPAIKDEVGEVYIGKRGDTHTDVSLRHGIDPVDVRSGYWHLGDKLFIHSDIDSSELMTPVQRMRKFGTE